MAPSLARFDLWIHHSISFTVRGTTTRTRITR
jgi:hypothetical protein